MIGTSDQPLLAGQKLFHSLSSLLGNESWEKKRDPNGEMILLPRHLGLLPGTEAPIIHTSCFLFFLCFIISFHAL